MKTAKGAQPAVRHVPTLPELFELLLNRLLYCRHQFKQLNMMTLSVSLTQRLINAINYLRPILEALYFLSATALAVFAFKGLKQIRLTVEQLQLTRDIAKTNAKRESFKLAADECRHFAQNVLIEARLIGDECKDLKLTTLGRKWKFKIANGEIAEHNFPELKVIAAEVSKCASKLITFLNSLEAFAIFFASGFWHRGRVSRLQGNWRGILRSG